MLEKCLLRSEERSLVIYIMILKLVAAQCRLAFLLDDYVDFYPMCHVVINSLRDVVHNTSVREFYVLWIRMVSL